LKAQRRLNILEAAAMLVAERGFRSDSIDDLGAVVGVSGPEVYRHFESKEAIHSDLLVGVSRKLLDEGSAEVLSSETACDALHHLVAFHTRFALNDPELIRVQDRDFSRLPTSQAQLIGRLQRAYVELWVNVLLQTGVTLSAETARVKVHATFGLSQFDASSWRCARREDDGKSLGTDGHGGSDGAERVTT
jgi:AcrR family transcriptional regulator